MLFRSDNGWTTWLAEGSRPAKAAGALAELLGQPGRAALMAHELSSRAAFLAR